MQPTQKPIVASLLVPALAAALAATATGCSGAFLGNFVVLGLTFLVFFGTLGLGRTRAPSSPAPGPADRSQQ